MVDIANVVQGFPGVRPLPGIEDAWTWPLSTMFTYGLALTSDGAHAVQMNMRGAGDEQLLTDVLSFARDRSTEVLAAVPFAVLDDFQPRSSDYRFDTVAAVLPTVYNLHPKTPELGKVTYMVFPAWRCEFSGRETEIEAKARLTKFLGAADLHRLPAPFLKMRFDNPKTGGGSIGTELGLARTDLLFTELRELEQAEGAWIEFQNFQNKVCRAYWQDGLRLAIDGGEGRPIEQNDLQTFAYRFLFEGVDDES
ncbi:hypothetical protein [Actinoplanes sp. NPDC049118]|uniref:hypothetical protein n=1 Tax=Actinoplanes sp. NPDC049118 TaxID=3155769 RepID=UPI0033D479F9